MTTTTLLTDMGKVWKLWIMSARQDTLTGAGWVPQPEQHDNTFGYRLREMRGHLSRRDGRRISADQLAEWCGVNGGTWGAWERDINTPPHFRAICLQIHEATGVSLDYLMYGDAAQSICTHAPWERELYGEGWWPGPTSYDQPLPLELVAA